MRRAATPSVCTSWPQMRAVPSVGIMKPASMRIVVDLPAPLGPRKPSTSPRATRNDTWSTAVKPPNRLVRPLDLDKHRLPAAGHPRVPPSPLWRAGITQCGGNASW